MSARPLKFRWQEALRDSGLKPTTRLVLLTLSTYANGHGGNAHPGRERLVHDTGLTLRTVAAAFREAVPAGWLVEVYRGGGRSGKASVWRLAIPARAIDEPSASADAEGLSRATDALSRATDDPSSSNGCPPIRTEDGIEEAQHSSPAGAAFDGSAADDDPPDRPDPDDEDEQLAYAETLFLTRGGNPRRLVEASNRMSVLITEQGFNWRHAAHTVAQQMHAPRPRPGPPVEWHSPTSGLDESAGAQSAASVLAALFDDTSEETP